MMNNDSMVSNGKRNKKGLDSGNNTCCCIIIMFCILSITSVAVALLLYFRSNSKSHQTIAKQTTDSLSMNIAKWQQEIVKFQQTQFFKYPKDNSSIVYGPKYARKGAKLSAEFIQNVVPFADILDADMKYDHVILGGGFNPPTIGHFESALKGMDITSDDKESKFEILRMQSTVRHGFDVSECSCVGNQFIKYYNIYRENYNFQFARLVFEDFYYEDAKSVQATPFTTSFRKHLLDSYHNAVKNGKTFAFISGEDYIEMSESGYKKVIELFAPFPKSILVIMPRDENAISATKLAQVFESKKSKKWKRKQCIKMYAPEHFLKTSAEYICDTCFKNKFN